MSTPLSPQPAGQVPANAHPMAPPPPGAMPTARLPAPLPESGRSTPIGFGRLLAVELRKQVDTRAGKWLLGITATLIVVISALVAWNERDHVKFYDLLGAAFIPMNYIVPILGIMAVTGEWSQRTGLVTFTLEPRRLRVALAKLAAALVLALAATAVAFASAALFTALMGVIGSGSPDWHLAAKASWTIPLGMMLQAAIGVAFGLLLQNTPGAICAYLFIPIAVAMLNIISWAQHAVEWISIGQAYTPLWDGSIHGDQWGKFSVATAIWLGIPAVLGVMRLNRREVKSS